jgi:hypothetical protein
MFNLIKKFMSKSSSPVGGKRGCLCEDGTYSSECCQGELPQQGIGSTEGQSNSSVSNTNEPRTIVRNNG